MTAIGYISGTKEIINASWVSFQHRGAAEFKSSEWSRVQPPLSAKNLPAGLTQVYNVRWNKRIDRHPAKGVEDCTPESISDTDNWLNWNGEEENPTVSKDNEEADSESNIELDNSIKVPESWEQRDGSAAPNVPGLIRPPQWSKKKAEQGFVTFTAMEMRRKKGIKKK